MRLFLIRHGESVDNVAGLYAGSRDSALTNHGVLQARRLGTHLASRSSTIGPIQHVFCSNLQRAVKTAEAVAEAQASVACVTGTPAVRQFSELRERDFGSDEGKRFGTRGQPVEAAARPVDWVEPESREAMKARIDVFVRAHLVPTIVQGFDSDINHSVVVVAHGIILNVLLRSLLARFGPREITRLSRPGDPSKQSEWLASWSNTGYLEANLRLVKKAVAINPTGPRPSAPPTGAAPAAAGVVKAEAHPFALHMTVQTVNCNHHLSGLKKTRGGIGSAAFDQKQRTLDSLFSGPAKKPKLGSDGVDGGSGTRG